MENGRQTLLRGGMVVDGTGSGPYRSDLVIEGEFIKTIGEVEVGLRGAEVIDVTGLYLMPGFIDCHSHADVVVRDRDVQAALLLQGVTSIICGQDGLSYIGANGFAQKFCEAYFGAILGGLDEDLVSVDSVDGWLEFWNHRTNLNYGALVPAGTIRANVVGLEERRATADETAQMVAQVSAGLGEGALGLSSGLEYVPGGFADEDELGVLARVVAQSGGVYVTHMRGYEQLAPKAMREVGAIVRQSGVRVHISHYHGPADLLLGELDKLRSVGVSVTFDSYPYLRSSTTLAKVVLPIELQGGGVLETMSRLREPVVREWLERTWFPSIKERVQKVTLSFIGNEGFKMLEGQRLDAVLESECGGVTGLTDLLLATELAVGCVFEYPASTSESDLRSLARDEGHCGGSDGIYLGRCPHPRGWGTFARFAGRHCRELSDWSWGDVAVHLAGRPAKVFGLADRGVLAEGRKADVIAIDPLRVKDVASYENPKQPAVGVSEVFVNGKGVVREGCLVEFEGDRGAGAGVALRGSWTRAQ